jgi:D-methionine transport system permease protein
MWESVDFDLLQEATLETLHMVGISTLMTAVLGIPLGVLLVVTDRGYFWENLVFQRILAFVVNIFRAVPFIILVLFLFPVAKLLVGTTLGPTAATIPLIAGAAPFYARMVETAIRDIDRGVIEAAQAMGASRLTIICKVLIPEAFPSIVSGLTVTCVSLISFSAMAGIVGAGGLGDTAYRFGFQAFNDAMLYSCGILLVVLVQLVQAVGDWIARALDKRS